MNYMSPVCPAKVGALGFMHAGRALYQVSYSCSTLIFVSETESRYVDLTRFNSPLVPTLGKQRQVDSDGYHWVATRPL